MKFATLILAAGAFFLASKMGYLPDYEQFPAKLVGGLLFSVGIIFFLSRS